MSLKTYCTRIRCTLLTIAILIIVFVELKFLLWCSHSSTNLIWTCSTSPIRNMSDQIGLFKVFRRASCINYIHLETISAKLANLTRINKVLVKNCVSERRWSSKNICRSRLPQKAIFSIGSKSRWPCIICYKNNKTDLIRLTREYLRSVAAQT